MEQAAVMRQITDLVAKIKPKYLIDGGDLFNQKSYIPVTCINLANEWLATLRPHTIVKRVKGNHDLEDVVEYDALLDATNFLDEDIPFEEGLKVRLVHYYESVDYESIKGYDLVVLHKQPTVCSPYGHQFDGVNWKTLAKNNRLVFFGHYHEQTKLSNNCFVIGSPMHLNFGDVSERGIYLVDTEDWSVKFIKLKYPRFITIDNFDSTKEKLPQDENYYRIYSEKRLDNENVVTVIEPKRFEERMKSDDFKSILEEWLQINDKPKSWLEPLDSVISSKGTLAKTFIADRLESVDITDFLSIGKVSYEVTPGFTLVAGQGSDFDSNGAGKTSIFDAIHWCLFGETTKGLTGNDVIRRGEKDCEVSLKIGEVRVTRSRKKGLTLEVKGEEFASGRLLKEKQSILEEQLLGFNKIVFLSACYFSQENLKTLTGLTDTDTTNMITDLLGFETYEDLSAQMLTKVREAEGRLITLEGSKVSLAASSEALEGKLVVIRGHIADIENDKAVAGKRLLEVRQEWQGHQERLDAFSKKLADGEKSVLEKQAMTDLTDMQATLNDKIASLRLEEREARSNCSRLETDVALVAREIKHAVSTLAKNKRELDSISAIDYGVRCDKCGAVVTEDNVGILVSAKEGEIACIDVEHAALVKDEATKMAKVATAAATVKSVLSKIDMGIEKLGKIQKDIIQIRAEEEANTKWRETLTSDIAATQRSIAELKRREELLVLDSEGYDGRLEVLHKDERSFKGSLADNVRKNLLLSEEALKAVGRKEMYEFWKVAFSSKGIRALLLDRFCNEFNRIVNEYLSLISNGSISVVMSPTKTLKTGEARNRMELQVRLGGYDVHYASLSGGEKRRLDVAACLGLNGWVSKHYDVPAGPLGILILDEIFSFLDKVGEESISTVLTAEGLKKAVYVISHTGELGSYADKQWQVVKRDGISALLTGAVV